MSFNWLFLRRASSSSMTLIRSITSSVKRPYQLGGGGPFSSSSSVLDLLNSSFVGRQFPPTFVRFLTAPIAQTCKKSSTPVENKTVTEEGLLAELPFKIKDGSPEEGYLILEREFQDAVIQVKVIPSCINIDDEYAMQVLEEDLSGRGCSNEWECYTKHNRSLYMLVTIDYNREEEDGGYNKFEKFFVVAEEGELSIRSVSSRGKNLEEFKQLFSEKVIEPSNVSDFCSIASSNVLESTKKKTILLQDIAST